MKFIIIVLFFFVIFSLFVCGSGVGVSPASIEFNESIQKNKINLLGVEGDIWNYTLSSTKGYVNFDKPKGLLNSMNKHIAVSLSNNITFGSYEDIVLVTFTKSSTSLISKTIGVKVRINLVLEKTESMSAITGFLVNENYKGSKMIGILVVALLAIVVYFVKGRFGGGNQKKNTCDVDLSIS